MRHAALALILATSLHAAPRQHPPYYEVRVDADGYVVGYHASSESQPSTSTARIVPWIDDGLIDADRTPLYQVVAGRLVKMSPTEVATKRDAMRPKPAERRAKRFQAECTDLVAEIAGLDAEISAEVDADRIAALRQERAKAVDKLARVRRKIRDEIPD